MIPMTAKISYLRIVDESFYDPRFDRVLSKLSTTIDKTDFRNAEADAREQFNLEWKQVIYPIKCRWRQ